MRPEVERILGSRPHGGKTSPGRPLESLTESWVPIWLPRSRCDRTPCPVCLLELTRGQEAIRRCPRANTMATVTESQAYRHRIASLCSRETEKKEKFPGSEERSLPSAVKAGGKDAVKGAVVGASLGGPVGLGLLSGVIPSSDRSSRWNRRGAALCAWFVPMTKHERGHPAFLRYEMRKKPPTFPACRT